MKKLLFGIIAVVAIAIAIVSLPSHGEDEDKLVSNYPKETVDGEDKSVIGTLSDKDIYFKADTMLPDNSVVNDLVDVANGYAILRAAYCDAELWFLFRMVVNRDIAKIRTDIIRDSGIRAATERYKERLLCSLPSYDKIANADSLMWEQVWNAYKDYADTLRLRYSISHYGQITQKDVWQYLDIVQFIPNYDSIYDLRRQQSEENECYLKLMIEQTPNFDRECLYTIEYAHQCRHQEPHSAIPLLEALMKSGKYSRFLHEVWRTWRVLRQIAESPSRDGIILNLEYNRMRYRCLNTILKQIVRNPEDIYAINDFFFLASYNNIIRYSEFLFGNSAPIEQMMLFPEIVEDSIDEYE